MSEKCDDQPEPVDEKKNANDVVQNPNDANRRDCNTWFYYPVAENTTEIWNHTNCPDPCITYKVKYMNTD